MDGIFMIGMCIAVIGGSLLVEWCTDSLLCANLAGWLITVVGLVTFVTFLM